MGSRPSRAELNALVKERIYASWRKAGRTDQMPKIDEDDNLFDLGVVDSLTMVEIIAFLEEISGGEPFDFLSMDPEVFFTLRGACDVVEARLA